MQFSINSGRLRDYVKILAVSSETNTYNEPEDTVLVFDARADVLVRSGDELHSYGVSVTSEIITVMMRYDARAKNSQLIEWDDKTYRIQHVKPDGIKQGMIITAEIESRGI